ncbi:MAG TPA: gliding motility-associated C-terminal domain-containing protein [Chitinophagaceae bacterium]
MHRLKHSLLILVSFFVTDVVIAQTCDSLGQKPSTAFPVCGVDTFYQGSVPVCGGNVIPGPCNGVDQVTLSDLNPYWYKFTCFTSGTLGFVLEPENLGDDYDWQLFDITGHSPNDVYTNDSLFVACNWSGSTGITGASPQGTQANVCATTPQHPNQPLFSTMPFIEQGHDYLLLVSHFFGDNQSGYKLKFTEGTAVITDPTSPGMLGAETSCDGSQIRLKLNKKMKCRSLAANGSDFAVPGVTSKIKSATGFGCNAGFDMDSVIITLDVPLQPGNYQLAIQNGSDQNTLLDNCDREIPVGSTVNFTVYGRQPTPLDSLAPVNCAPRVLQIPFRKNIRCSSIAANGSDFTITGPYPVTITSADGICEGGLSKIIKVHLSTPIVHAGTYTIQLKTGTDGNTVIDECGEETIAGATISFSVKDTVSADFTYKLIEGCQSDEIDYFNNGGSSITQWNWTFDSAQTSTQQNPVINYYTFGDKRVQLIVTNGFCSDTTVQNFHLNHDTLQANFVGPDFYCPNDLAYFKDTSLGNIIGWNWEFGNGNKSEQQNPPAQYYATTERERLFPVRLIVQSNKLCTDTIVKYIKVISNCYIAVPTAFTPNHDGKNDYLFPLNAYKATHLQFRVFNKYGQQLFETKDWTHKWDGTFNGIEQPSGVYVWMLEYTDLDTGKKIFQKGTTVLIR